MKEEYYNTEQWGGVGRFPLYVSVTPLTKISFFSSIDQILPIIPVFIALATPVALIIALLPPSPLSSVSPVSTPSPQNRCQKPQILLSLVVSSLQRARI